MNHLPFSTAYIRALVGLGVRHVTEQPKEHRQNHASNERKDWLDPSALQSIFEALWKSFGLAPRGNVCLAGHHLENFGICHTGKWGVSISQCLWLTDVMGFGKLPGRV